MKNNLITLVISLLMSIHSYSFANVEWGKTGHRAVGEIATKHLKKKVLKKIDKLLGGESLAFVSTYADEIKSDKRFNKFYSWHYVNFPMDSDYNSSEKNEKGDIVTGINFCVEVLKNKDSSKEDKVFYLKMLVHLIGDLHQPLHVGRAEDKGGNTIQVQWFKKGTNLHHVWDIDMIEKWNMSYMELCDNAKDLTKKEIQELQNGSILDWIRESRSLAKKVYNSVENGDKLSYRYSYDHLETLRTQLQKGGIRLAGILNDIFC